eukprot:jgi/Tetstr1/460343/TSEL_005643.t1
MLGESAVITGEDECAPYNSDWMRKYTGQSQIALKPRTTEQVAAILEYCNRRKLAVVPQGGNTGLVGGSVPVYDEVVLNTSNMNSVHSIDPISGVLVCQAGCVLQRLDDYARDHGFIMPLDLGAKGSCQIGGNVATNAGGLRLVRYGSLHGSVLGLEVVLANGTVLDLLQTLRKDNTGYDLKQLFIGSEGTLGVITAVSIMCSPAPTSVQTTFLAVSSFEAVQQVLRKAKQRLGEILSACEFMDSASMEVVTAHVPGTRSPLAATHPFYAIVETSGSNKDHDREKLEMFLEEVMLDGTVNDGTIAESDSAAAGIWRLREGISEACLHAGQYLFKYDMSYPIADVYSIVPEMRRRLKDRATVIGYGHLGDGNLHLNIMSDDSSVAADIEPFVYEFTSQRSGSISAEHGLGLMKGEKIGYSKAPEAIEAMANLKALFDPNLILNPYKVLPRGEVRKAMSHGGNPYADCT